MSFFSEVVWDFVKQNPVLVAANVAFMITVPVNDVLLPHLYSRVIDAVENGKDVMIQLCIVAVVVAAVQAGNFARDWLDTKQLPKLEIHIQQALLRKILEKYETAYADVNTGEVLAKFSSVPAVITRWIWLVNETYLPYTFVFIATLLYFGYHDASLAVLLITLAVIVVYCLLKTPHRCGDDAYRTDKSREDMLEQVDETLRNLPSVYGARKGENEITTLEDLARVYSKNYSETMRCGIQARVGVSCGLVAIFIAFTVRLVQLVRYKRIGAPQFASLFMVFTTLAFNVMWILNSSRYAVFDGGVVQNIDKFLATTIPPSTVSATMAVSLTDDQQLLPPFPDRLGLHNVSFTYKSGTKKVLDNLSISFEPGHITSLLGGIGTGKSTIVRLLLGLQRPDTGDLYLPGGQWYSDVDVSVVRKHVGYVPQEPMLFDRTVLQNIQYGSEQHFTEQEVLGVLQETGVADIFTSLSHGVNSKVGKNGSRLSGGQRQLVWFMRVLLQRPQALVLDEPTASMDQPTKQVLARLLRTYVAAGYIAIVVTHDDFLKHVATRSIHLNDVR